jgi:glycosyltransferase involved in cell wall biosynthesis
VAQLIEGFALQAAKDDNIRLVCVGGAPDSSDTSMLTERIVALEPAIAQRIRLVHGISDGALKSIYKSVGVCVSMSLHEGFGVPLVDALLFDKPLVINAEAGMMETAGEAAIVVDALSPEAVANALGATLNDNVTRERLASARRTRLEALRRLADGHLILNAVNQARDLHRARSV